MRKTIIGGGDTTGAMTKFKLEKGMTSLVLGYKMRKKENL